MLAVSAHRLHDERDATAVIGENNVRWIFTVCKFLSAEDVR
jgi:hypothetical protein